MEIFSQNSRYITNLLVKFQNSEIDKKILNHNMFADIAFNYFYLKKTDRKIKKAKKNQINVFKEYMNKEIDLAKEIDTLKRKNPKRKLEEKDEIKVNQKRKEILDDLFSHKGINVYIEDKYNSYIPQKNLSISMSFHIKENKQYKKYLSESNTNINYKNPGINPKKDKIYISYDEPPFAVDENTDIFLLNKEEKNQEKDIIKNVKNENINKLKTIMNDIDEDDLFYPEKIEDQEDIKIASKWLSEVNNDEIMSNFNSLSEERKNNKNFNFSNFFYFETNFNLTDIDPSSIFDEIPHYEDRYKKFNQYLSDISYKNFMKKMNYNYLDLMLIIFFDLLSEFQKYNFLEKEMVALSFIKKFILNCGISHSKIYKNIIKVIATKKNQFNFENFLDCFTPILENKVAECQTLKYKFLMNLVNNQKDQIVSMENYKVFCNLIKGKSVFEEENYRKLSKEMIEMFKIKYPRENADDFKFFQILSVIEVLIDGDVVKIEKD